MEKILILGGTNFIGRNLVETLIELGKYELTLYNRGQTNKALFPNLELIKGDRNTSDGANAIKGQWDYIIDLSCYFPNSLQQIIPNVGTQLKKYIFISTCSVYELGKSFPLNENSNLKTCLPEDWEDETDRTYGERKVACETLLQKSNLNYTILRPGLVYGKYDHTDRFYYWLHQVKNYSKIGLPNKGVQKFSVTYIEDLTNSILQSITPKEDKEAYNIVSFPEMSIHAIVETASRVLNQSPQIIDLPPKLLHDNKITQWTDMPLWIDGDFFVCTNQKMKDEFDFQMVPFEQSVKDTITHYEILNWHLPTYGISREKQLALMS